MRVAVAGAGGAIGGHLVGRLLDEGHQVIASDIKPAREWWQHHQGAACLSMVDCSTEEGARTAVRGVDWVFDLAEEMGGIHFITSERVRCAESITIGINLLRAAAREHVSRFFFASSACVYNTALQMDPMSPALTEDMAWPARPEDGYGFAKLYMEELCRHYREDGLLDTRVARYHNVYGPHGTWVGGREKSPAALCRKVAMAKLSGAPEIEVWGDGEQTRSYCYVDDCVEGSLRLMTSDWVQPLNIGSDRLVSVDHLATMAMDAAGYPVRLRHVPGPQGVRGRNSDNTLCRATLGWEPQVPLELGVANLYHWVEGQVRTASRA